MLRRSLPLLVVLLACNPAETLALSFEARVVRVADGDSLTVVDAAGKQLEIRISGIDAPEKGESFADQSREALKRSMERQTLLVEVDDVDQYGRLVARLRLDGLDVGLRQIERGLAWVYPSANKLPVQVRRRYAEAERRARATKVGLWSEGNPTPPWVQRRNARAVSTSRSPEAEKSGKVGAIVGNRRSKVYHRPNCPGYETVSAGNRELFVSAEAAEAAGYRLAGNCPR
ncbi:MAG TPA: thermonuclease family protein [Thermoanaerobaculia bacterium]